MGMLLEDLQLAVVQKVACAYITMFCLSLVFTMMQVIGMLFVELLHVVCAFLTLDNYRTRETTFGNNTPPHW